MNLAIPNPHNTALKYNNTFIYTPYNVQLHTITPYKEAFSWLPIFLVPIVDGSAPPDADPFAQIEEWQLRRLDADHVEERAVLVRRRLGPTEKTGACANRAVGSDTGVFRYG